MTPLGRSLRSALEQQTIHCLHTPSLQAVLGTHGSSRIDHYFFYTHNTKPTPSHVGIFTLLYVCVYVVCFCIWLTQVRPTSYCRRRPSKICATAPEHGGRKERGEGLVRCSLTLLFFPSTRSSQGADPSPGPDTEPPRHHIHPSRFCEQPLVPNLGHGAGAGPNTQGPERGWMGWREGYTLGWSPVYHTATTPAIHPNSGSAPAQEHFRLLAQRRCSSYQHQNHHVGSTVSHSLLWNRCCNGQMSNSQIPGRGVCMCVCV